MDELSPVSQRVCKTFTSGFFKTRKQKLPRVCVYGGKLSTWGKATGNSGRGKAKVKWGEGGERADKNKEGKGLNFGREKTHQWCKYR